MLKLFYILSLRFTSSLSRISSSSGETLILERSSDRVSRRPLMSFSLFLPLFIFRSLILSTSFCLYSLLLSLSLSQSLLVCLIVSIFFLTFFYGHYLNTEEKRRCHLESIEIMFEHCILHT